MKGHDPIGQGLTHVSFKGVVQAMKACVHFYRLDSLVVISLPPDLFLNGQLTNTNFCRCRMDLNSCCYIFRVRYIHPKN